MAINPIFHSQVRGCSRKKNCVQLPTFNCHVWYGPCLSCCASVPSIAKHSNYTQLWENYKICPSVLILRCRMCFVIKYQNIKWQSRLIFYHINFHLVKPLESGFEENKSGWCYAKKMQFLVKTKEDSYKQKEGQRCPFLLPASNAPSVQIPVFVRQAHWDLPEKNSKIPGDPSVLA